MRCYDSISGYKFVLIVNQQADPRKVDGKLEEIYKVFVNYVIKAPFFNVKFTENLEITKNREPNVQKEE